MAGVRWIGDAVRRRNFQRETNVSGQFAQATKPARKSKLQPSLRLDRRKTVLPHAFAVLDGRKSFLSCAFAALGVARVGR